MRVSKICVKRIRVNQGLVHIFVSSLTLTKAQLSFTTISGKQMVGDFAYLKMKKKIHLQGFFDIKKKEENIFSYLFKWMIECSVETSATFANKDEVAANKESCKRILASYRL